MKYGELQKGIYILRDRIAKLGAVCMISARGFSVPRDDHLERCIDFLQQLAGGARKIYTCAEGAPYRSEELAMTAFIASQMTGMEDLRLRIHQQFGHRVWLSEHSTTPSYLKHRSLEDVCLEQVRTSQKFVCIFDGRYGTYSGFPSNDDTHVTLFELEMFQAFLSEKSIFLFFLGHNPSDPRVSAGGAWPGCCSGDVQDLRWRPAVSLLPEAAS